MIYYKIFQLKNLHLVNEQTTLMDLNTNIAGRMNNLYTQLVSILNDNLALRNTYN